ncbi:MAG: hypothetical protein JWQ59_2114 [Cryobacterium sp.]|jgi:hypothetical protein|nr:hypothetical protein [Cryobacterium sp.]
MNGSPVQLDILPVLSPGKHRNPRKGACFMEYASFLAGERWSDHPACTHAGLAHLARMVNDCTSDAGRSRLAPLIPSVIGLTSDDPRLDLVIAVRAASAALPIAAEERQRAVAVGAIVSAGRLERMGGAEPVDVQGSLRAAFAAAPAAERWARTFISAYVVREPRMDSVRHSHSVIAAAVDGIASACIEDPDQRLYDLLMATIDDCTAFTRAQGSNGASLRPVSAPKSSKSEASASMPRVSTRA